MPCYILKAGDTDKVKIGWAGHVETRRKLLETAHWEDLILIRSIDGGSWVERAMHRRFEALRVRREWFRFDPEMMTFEPTRKVSGSDAAMTRQHRGKPGRHKGRVDAIRGDATLHSDLIWVVGGKAIIAQSLGIPDRSITRWHERGIPSKYWHPIIDLAAALPNPVAVTADQLMRTRSVPALAGAAV